ncbi:MAG: phosphonate ABC transporter ATP-binding protein [Desulfocapsa sp.]|nr:phosphonate ABC transporter ATP-binding protein [Desulfocapsa sp.]
MISFDAVNLGYSEVPILENISFHVGKGEFLGIIGLSGAGKSTLLMSIIGNIRVLKGRYQVFGHDLSFINKRDLRELRSRIGFIFQGYNLVNRLSVLHNVMSGMLKDISLGRALIKFYTKQEVDKAYEYMEVVGIEHLAMKRCDELSGGQRQRVAIARALAQEPNVLLADEPVAALDPKSAAQVMDVLRRVNETYGVTVISNLHHLDFAREYCSRIIGVAAGSIAFDGLPGELQNCHLDTIYENNVPAAEEKKTTNSIQTIRGFPEKSHQEQEVYDPMVIAA